MTATVLLIRHAAHAHIGATLSGRQPNLPLTEGGHRQAAALADKLRNERLSGIQASPVLRAQQTAEALAAATALPVQTVAALDEIDFGAWTGTDFASLEDDPRWRDCNVRRATAQAPGGESMASAQARIVAHIEATAAALGGRTVAMISHCDLIRAAIAHYLELSLDRMLRFDVDPASVSRLSVAEGSGQLINLNEKLA